MTGTKEKGEQATLPAVAPQQQQAQPLNAMTIMDGAMSVDVLMRQIQLIQKVMKDAMKEGEHYGVVPGCGKKKALLKAGAEKLAFVFRMRHEYIPEVIDMPNSHREYRVKCQVYQIGTNVFLGEGIGSACTMETKWRFRSGPKEFTGKAVPQDYWNKRKTDPKGAQKLIGGPGYATSKNPDKGNKWEIVKMGERIEHDNPADNYNTALKMAKKRAAIDATLTCTAASDIFTQDIDDDDFDKNSMNDDTPYDDSGEQHPQGYTDETAGAANDPEQTRLAVLRNEILYLAIGKHISDINLGKSIAKQYGGATLETLTEKQLLEVKKTLEDFVPKQKGQPAPQQDPANNNKQQ